MLTTDSFLHDPYADAPVMPRRWVAEFQDDLASDPDAWACFFETKGLTLEFNPKNPKVNTYSPALREGQDYSRLTVPTLLALLMDGTAAQTLAAKEELRQRAFRDEFFLRCQESSWDEWCLQCRERGEDPYIF